MKIYSSHELIRLIQKDGWFLVRVRGSHHQFKHLMKKGLTTVPHLRKELDPKTLKSIKQQAGLQF